MAPSLCSKEQVKELSNLAQTLKDKPVSDDARSFLLQFWTEYPFQGLSVLAARSLISFVRTLFGDKKVVFSHELARLLINLTAFDQEDAEKTF